ncbi:MAG TPA: hypothetical protein PKD79_03715 [Candidatus Doudnabacteria bacterium]|nr:hypothetical protein [Candidatus Doudnabacteria bacterium]
MKPLFVRNISMRRQLDSFFIAAASTVLITRAFLFLTGWPMLGGESLHIAHMLWGGLGMLIALILLFSFIGQRIQYLAALIGGLGFGLFIDELGKFLTHDNDYFFQPTAMLIYFFFIGLYFLIRELDKQTKLTEEERAVNALLLSQEMILSQFNEVEKKRLQKLLKRPGKHASLFKQLQHIMDQTQIRPLLWMEEVSLLWEKKFFKFAKSKSFAPIVIILLLIQSFLIISSFQTFWTLGTLTFTQQLIVVIGMGSAVIAAMYVVRGLVLLRKNRLEGFSRIYRANLISILLTQPFAFYVASFVPVLSLIINILSFIALRYLIELEERK